jgi:glycosyltransferase involved in cell wall biosynthesis
MAVCCLDEPGAWAGELQREGIAVHALGRAPGFRPSVGRQLAGIAARERATVLHCHHYSPFVYGALARWWHPARIIFTEHGRLHNQAASSKRLVANTLFGRMASSVCAVSDDLKRHLVAEGFTPERIRVVYNGIDAGPLPDAAAKRDARALIGAAPGEAIIGAVGRFDPVKDLPTLIRAFGVVRSALPQTRLVLVGDGPERSLLERIAADQGLHDRVTFTGYRADVRALLPAFDLYVNSSLFEGVSLTILEAMAAGVPVVATRVGGTPEVIDRSTGVLVPPADASALASALGAMLRDEPTRTALGAAARARVERLFSIDRMTEDYASMYAHPEAGACAA